MIARCLHAFYGGLQYNLHHWQVYSGVPQVNVGKTGKTRVDTSESWHTMCLIFGRVGNKLTMNCLTALIP